MPSCPGARIGHDQNCLVHSLNKDWIQEWLSHGDVDGRGVQITGADLARVLEMLPKGPGGQPRAAAVDFQEATFPEFADFDNLEVVGEARFVDAVFAYGASFVDAVFKKPAQFRGINVAGEARFVSATAPALDLGRSELGAIDLNDAHLGALHMAGAQLHGDAEYANSTIQGRADFENVVFGDYAVFFSQYSHAGQLLRRALRWCRDIRRDDV